MRIQPLLAAATIVTAVVVMLLIVTQAKAHRTVWDRLAACESSGRWHYNGSSGFDGGLQFLPSTWTKYKRKVRRPWLYPRYAWQAPRWKQIVVALHVVNAEGWGAWPACSRRLGLR